MEAYPDLVLMGQDIAEYGGVFKVTDGFVERFGKERVRNTPLCESAIVGAALGLSIAGKKAMMNAIGDFVTSASTKSSTTSPKSTGAGSNKPMWSSACQRGGNVKWPIPQPIHRSVVLPRSGLKVVYPSRPADAKGFYCAPLKIRTQYFFEHKYLYRSLSGPVPEEPYTIELEQAHRAVGHRRYHCRTPGRAVGRGCSCAQSFD